MIYLAAIAVVTTIGVALLLLRNRPNTSVEAGIDDFRRNLQALSPDPSFGESRRTDPGSDTDDDHYEDD